MNDEIFTQNHDDVMIELDKLGSEMTRLRGAIRTLIVLVIINIIVTAYVADFVYRIINDIHAL